MKKFSVYDLDFSNRSSKTSMILISTSITVGRWEDIASGKEKILTAQDLTTINDVLGRGRDSVVSLDVGIHAFLACRHLKIKSSKPGAWLFPGGFYPMGFSFPAAVGAKFADKNNEKTVISLTGDGAFSMVMCDLETLVRYELPMTTIVFNDSAYGLIKFQQLEYDKKIRAVNLTRTDYAKIAEGFGADGIKVDPTDVGSFKAALNEAISSQRPTVIDVDVNTIKVFEDLLEKS